MGYQKICFIYCKKCKHVKAKGDDNFITVGGLRFISSNPLTTCGKCGNKLKLVWDHQEGFDQARDIYSTQLPNQVAARKQKNVDKELEL